MGGISLKASDFDFVFPPELIAQTPTPQRDQSRLLVLRRDSGQIAHRSFGDLLEYLQPGDVLVLNNSRVIPARLRGINARTGGHFELLLLEQNAINDWWAMLRPGKRARAGTRIAITAPGGGITGMVATVVDQNEEGHRRLQFTGTPNIVNELETIGEIPLPPYIQRAQSGSKKMDRERYQTVYASPAGSVAAPTAGLHFTEKFLAEIRARDVLVCFVTLHVGLGTFAPVKSDTVAGHKMHEERFELSEETARVIKEAKRLGKRVIAVGTTTVRVLESVAKVNQSLLTSSPTEMIWSAAGGGVKGSTNIFIYPPFDFKVVDAVITNFHLPRSTLLMLVSAFAAPGNMNGREMIVAAYREAIQERYRFFSYGDAMLIL
jgi:S-adenosylmethionine:tRNA ribosyltransferase-isomerase